MSSRAITAAQMAQVAALLAEVADIKQLDRSLFFGSVTAAVKALKQVGLALDPHAIAAVAQCVYDIAATGGTFASLDRMAEVVVPVYRSGVAPA